MNLIEEKKWNKNARTHIIASEHSFDDLWNVHNAPKLTHIKYLHEIVKQNSLKYKRVN